MIKKSFEYVNFNSSGLLNDDKSAEKSMLSYESLLKSSWLLAKYINFLNWLKVDSEKVLSTKLPLLALAGKQ